MPMIVNQFESNLDRFGPDLAKWPDVDRKLAFELLENNPQARQLLKSEQELAAEIETAMIVPTPYGMKHKILNHVDSDQANKWIDFFFQNLWRPALLALIPVMAGFVVGASTQETYSDLDVELVLETFADYTEIEADLQ